MSNEKKSPRKRTSGQAREKKRAQEREQLAELYRQVYDRCMEGESKGFDAKGALSALEQLGKMKGLDTAPEESADTGVVLTLSEKVGERGD